MSRTLGLVDQDQSLQEQQQSQPFYLSDELPMFLVHNQNEIKNQGNTNEDAVICKILIEKLCDNQIKTKEQINSLAEIIQNEKDLTKGMAYFSAKNALFLEYLVYIKLYQLFKINGKTLTEGNGLQLYKRLAYLKTLLLKLQPVQKKLEYQKNKILKSSDIAIVTKQQKKEEPEEQQPNEGIQQNQNLQIEEEREVEEDQMAFKPRPSSLMRVKQEKDLKIIKNQKYEAPKVSSNLSKQEKLKQRFEKQKQRRKLGLIRRLQSDLLEDDRAEEKYMGDEVNQRLNKKFQQKIAYQQQAFVRLPDNRKDKHFKKQMVRNSMRKNQLQEDFKQIQMVKHLFDQQEKAQVKLTKESNTKKNPHTKKSQFHKRGGHRQHNQHSQKTKKIRK